MRCVQWMYENGNNLAIVFKQTDIEKPLTVQMNVVNLTYILLNRRKKWMFIRCFVFERFSHSVFPSKNFFLLLNLALISHSASNSYICCSRNFFLSSCQLGTICLFLLWMSSKLFFSWFSQLFISFCTHTNTLISTINNK